MKTALVVSAFDIVDTTDVALVRQAANECDRVVVRVLSDELVLTLSGRPAVVPEHERLEIVSALRDVSGAALYDQAVLFDAVPSLGDEAVVYGRLDQYSPGIPVDRWLEPAAALVPGLTSPVLPERSPSSEGHVVGYVPGAWDMFHIGHLNILRNARPHCDWLVAGVVTDDELARAKGRSPTVTLADRVDVVSALKLVDEVVVDYSSSKLDAWQRVRFDVLFKGDDWKGTPKGDRLEAEMATVGAVVRYFPYTEHTSSTALRRILAAN